VGLPWWSPGPPPPPPPPPPQTPNPQSPIPNYKNVLKNYFFNLNLKIN